MSGSLKVKVSAPSLILLSVSVARPRLPVLSVPPNTTGSLLCSSAQQLGADPQSCSEVYAVLKGTSLFCYHRQEDVEASVEPAFTIAVNKVSEGNAGWWWGAVSWFGSISRCGSILTQTALCVW